MLYFVFSIFLSFIFVLLVTKKAYRLGLLDVPNERSHHRNIIPSGGGVGFVSALFVSLALFQTELLIEHWYLFTSIFMVFVVGILDDRHDVSPRLKFLVIFFAVFLLWIFEISIYSMGTFFGFELSLGWLALSFSMFAVAGLTNALNLIDGIDGLAGSVSIVIIAFFAYIGYENANLLILTLSLSTIAVLCGFLLLNWNPAKVFLGDSGSLTLGFIISILAVLSVEHIHPVTTLYLTALPVLDTLVVMVRRIRRGHSPFRADKTHIHHIMVKFFDDNVKRTVIFLILLQMSFSSIGYLLNILISQNSNGLMSVFSLFNFAIVFVLSYMVFTGIKKRQNKLDNVDL